MRNLAAELGFRTQRDFPLEILAVKIAAVAAEVGGQQSGETGGSGGDGMWRERGWEGMERDGMGKGWNGDGIGWDAEGGILIILPAGNQGRVNRVADCEQIQT